MAIHSKTSMRGLLLGALSPEGEPIGQVKLQKLFNVAIGSDETAVSSAKFVETLDALIAEGLLLRGKGGSLRRAVPVGDHGDAFSLEAQHIPAESLKPQPKQENLTLAQAIAKSNSQTPGASAKKGTEDSKILSYRYADKRVNNPQVGLVNVANDPGQPKTTWRYDPHIDPALSFDVGLAEIETLIDDALASGDETRMRNALHELKRAGSPYLNWAGKAERTSFDIDTVSLHVHERIDPMSILAVVSKRIKDAKAGKRGTFQPGLFDAAFENLPLRDAIDFYKHERGWADPVSFPLRT